MNSLTSTSSSIDVNQVEAALQQTPGTERWNIRLVRSSDTYALSELIAGSFHSRTGWMGWAYPLLQIGITEDLRQRLKSPLPNYICLVAEEVDPRSKTTTNPSYPLLRGTVEMALKTGYPFRQRSCQWYYLSNLAVQASYRRQGIAEKLLIACEQVALLLGYRDLYLHVLEDNYQAQGLYEKRGYRFKQADPDLGTLLFHRPRRLLLHKTLNYPSNN